MFSIYLNSRINYQQKAALVLRFVFLCTGGHSSWLYVFSS